MFMGPEQTVVVSLAGLYELIYRFDFYHIASDCAALSQGQMGRYCLVSPSPGIKRLS